MPLSVGNNLAPPASRQRLVIRMKKGSRVLSSHHYHNFFGIEWYRSRGEEPQDGAMLRSSTILLYDDA
ncbi:hypothetical protein FOXG_22699 [Fusarium oxysporum f. sp. lycopersici 4287]|uniref:Uncharacterized protein n=1 Tax=Fusarium oxysporum f. sp. lycopersici (strain 4287 / CBS 123668 / FGSC 9935 / NRRL 34936) TaxID=426428 RepID=A0A0J9WVQ9_FUSO4|nr:hypothetical protein FOXG_22699 [Fusarium oxysporum f. sp. lycopersici 4287]EWZ77716.1 hypothetical protein FOWG_17900 [Fusarium oxysporum f. sp. lycopersici MN25]KNB19962.1 hypothetical protein FOXG_22699 [Fusarium oxysporum f. sp. lycopersici 4287]